MLLKYSPPRLSGPAVPADPQPLHNRLPSPTGFRYLPSSVFDPFESLENSYESHPNYWIDSIKFRISEAFQAVVRGPNLRGDGNFPDFTPAHQEDLLIGISCKIVQSRTNPISGRTYDLFILLLLAFNDSLLDPNPYE
jgi:hypothetical protein